MAKILQGKGLIGAKVASMRKRTVLKGTQLSGTTETARMRAGADMMAECAHRFLSSFTYHE